MSNKSHFDVIIIGGSYAGLAAAMALGRSLRKVLVIDSGKPCNRQTPYSHNFLTNDGKTPAEIAVLSRKQVTLYDTVSFFNSEATTGKKTEGGFEIITSSGKIFTATKLILATGIKDIMPNIPGLPECWGISVLHCPYCHGFEVKNEVTGILGNGEKGFEFARLISNWTKDLILFSNGKSNFTREQAEKIKSHKIKIVEHEIEKLEHQNGHLQYVILKDGSTIEIKALYARLPFEQHSAIVSQLGCELNDDGYIKIDNIHQTTKKGIFACGDNTTRMRTVANAVAMGTATGMMINNELIEESF